MKAVNREGESVAILTPKLSSIQIVDGTSGHAASTALEQGIYRIAVQSSASDAGCHIMISTTGTSATVANGIFMGNGLVEYYLLTAGSIIDVINGKINICQFS